MKTIKTLCFTLVLSLCVLGAGWASASGFFPYVGVWQVEVKAKTPLEAAKKVVHMHCTSFYDENCVSVVGVHVLSQSQKKNIFSFKLSVAHSTYAFEHGEPVEKSGSRFPVSLKLKKMAMCLSS